MSIEQSGHEQSSNSNGNVSSSEERKRKRNDIANKSYHRREKARKEAQDKLERKVREKESENQLLLDQIRQSMIEYFEYLTTLLGERDQAVNADNAEIYGQQLRSVLLKFAEFIARQLILHNRASTTGDSEMTTFYHQNIQDCECFVSRLNEYERSNVLRNVEMAIEYYKPKS